MRAGRENKVKRKTAAATFDRGTEAAEVFAAVLARQHKELTKCIGRVLETETSTGPHHTRVTLRRMRATLRALPADDDAELEGLRAELAELGRAVGQLRDCDALVEDILAPAIEHAGGIDTAGLTALITRTADRRRADVRARLVAKSTRLLLSRTGGLPKAVPTLLSQHAGRAIGEEAQRTLRKRWRRTAKLGDDIAAADIDQLHELRKALKTLRYSFELFAPLYPGKTAAQFSERLKAMQNALGYLNDVASAEALIDLAGDADRHCETSLAAGFVLGFHRARAAEARPRIDDCWQRLMRSRLVERRFKL